MTQKTWEIKNSKVITENICCDCGELITHHAHYNDTRFCESCKNEITESYYEKCNNPEDKEQIQYFDWDTPEKFLQSVYEELTNNSDSLYWE